MCKQQLHVHHPLMGSFIKLRKCLSTGVLNYTPFSRYLMSKLYKVTFYLPSTNDSEDVSNQLPLSLYTLAYSYITFYCRMTSSIIVLEYCSFSNQSTLTFQNGKTNSNMHINMLRLLKIAFLYCRPLNRVATEMAADGE